MSATPIWLYILVMAGVTYLIRMVPLVAIKKKIQNRFLLSFLHYVPYAVLGAMTFPAVFSSTGSLATAAVGVAAALVTAFFEKSLMTVAAVSCAAVFLSGWIGGLIF